MSDQKSDEKSDTNAVSEDIQERASNEDSLISPDEGNNNSSLDNKAEALPPSGEKFNEKISSAENNIEFDNLNDIQEDEEQERLIDEDEEKVLNKYEKSHYEGNNLKKKAYYQKMDDIEDFEESDNIVLNFLRKIVYKGAEYVLDVPSKVTKFDPVGIFNNTFFAVNYTSTDTRKRLVSFLIGLLTIIIVVFSVSVLYNSILKAPIIFLKLAEDSAGEMDMIMISKFTNTSQNPFLNYTSLEEKLSNTKELSGISPRWLSFGYLVNTNNRDMNTSALIMLIDSEKEEEVRLGRTWKHRELGDAEAHIRDGLLRAVGIQANQGQRFNLQFDIQSLLEIASGQNQAISQQATSNSVTNNPIVNPTQVLDRNTTRALVLSFLENQFGFTLNGTTRVNVTQIAENLGVTIPAPFEIIDVSNELLFNIVFNALFPENGSGAFSVNQLLEMEFTAVDAITSSEGKYPSALGNIAVIDSRYLKNSLIRALNRNVNLQFILSLIPQVRNTIDQQIDSFNLNDFALTIVGKYKNRLTAYLKSEKELNKEMIQFTNSIFNTLGIAYPSTIQLPLVQALVATRFISLFLDQIFVGVVVMLAILGIILIFALLLANVEEKTYEYGMLRALGLKKLYLVQVILTQALYFAIPGVIIGLFLSFIVNAGVEFAIAWYASLPYSNINYMLNYVAILIPIALGITIPVIANIIPIRRAMSRTLRDSLDIAHQSFNETSVKMIKLEKLGLEPWQTTVAVLMVVIGFVVYYIIPYSFIFQNLPLFFSILNLILLGMLLGLCMVAVVIQPFFERAILFLILWGPDRRMKSLILKNLAGHRSRSRKTFLMFTMSVAFVIFAGVVFSLQTSNIVQNVELLLGSDLSVISNVPAYPLPTDKLSPYLDRLKKRGVVDGYTYISFDLRVYSHVEQNRISSLAFYPTRRAMIYYLPENFLEVAYSKYFLYNEYDNSFNYKKVSGKPDVIRSLYVDAGKAKVDGESDSFTPERIFSGRKIGQTLNDTLNFDPSIKYKEYIDVIISEALRDEVSINTDTAIKMKTYLRNPSNGRKNANIYIAKARAMVYKMPAFFYSSYRVSSFITPVLITGKNYRKLYNDGLETVGFDIKKLKTDEEIPKQRLLVNFNSGVSKQDRVDTINGIRNFLEPDFTFVNDVLDVIDGTKTATTALNTFFYIVSFIAIVLCFFMLMISFTSNVNENSWEFGVLRAVGLSVSKLIRAYIYEAMVLVVAAYVCGTIIGISIALTLTAQFNLFLEMPFSFNFPYLLFAVLGVMAVIVAVLGSYLPARKLRRKEIALVLKGLD